MPKTLCYILGAWLAAGAESTVAAANFRYALTNAFPGLTFTNPLCLAAPPGETNRLFIVEKKGRIVVITNLAAPSRAIFMDISSSSSVISAADTTVGGEEGLLGLAFHPGYVSNGYFYVFYTGTATTTAGSGRHDILSRFKVSAANPNQGNAGSEARFIVQYDQADNHNAGDLHFGADGYLYVSLGDEGGSYGQYTNTQRIDHDFFSAIMRLDVDRQSGSLAPNAHASALPALTNYAIPPDNPYVGATNFNGLAVSSNNVRTEFWAVGMRNPWRFAFDPPTGALYLGHVGQGQVEWVNIVTKGANCGWNYYEGGKQWTNQIPAGFVFSPPLTQYGHTNSRNCIIGGVVYHGSRIPSLQGAYLYADHMSGEFWALRNSGTNVTQNSIILTNTAAKPNAFGVDPANGEVLIAAARGGTDSTIERLAYIPPVPRFTQISLSPASVVLRGTNGGSNQTFYVLAATNIALPRSNWTALATGAFDAAGNFALTSSIAPSLRQRFYRLLVP